MKTKRILLQFAILALPLLFFAFTGWCGYCLLMQGHTCGIIIAALSIVTGGWVFLSALHSLSKRSWLVIALFLLLCGWGMVAHQLAEYSEITGNVLVKRLIAPLNETLSIFFPSRGDYDYAHSISYHLLHLSSYFFCVLFLFSIFGRRLINSSRRFLYLHSNKNIFWGDSPGGMLLAQDILNAKLLQQTVFIFSHQVKDEANKEKTLFETVDLMGGIVLYRDFDNIRRYPGGHRHFFLTEDHDFNLKMALKVAKNSRQKIEIYLRTEMPRVDYLFRHLTNIDLHIINQSGIVARQLVSEYPLINLVPRGKINGMTVDFEFNILLLGFGGQGRELLNKIICDVQFKGSKFAATIIDRDIDLRYGDYQLLFDECISEYHLNFLDDEGGCNMGGSSFYRWFRENHRQFDRIIVALDDDAKNLNYSLALANVMIAGGEMKPEEKLFVHIAHEDKYSYRDYPVTMFGKLNGI